MSYAKPTKAKTLTPEQIRAERVRFFAEKRETFALNILCCLCQGVSSARSIVKADMHSTTIAIDTNGLVNDAVKMADELMEKLYSPTQKEGENK